MLVLIATDGSSSADRAVEYGAELACEVDARVLLVSVRHTPSPILGAPYYQRRLHADFVRARAALAAAEAFLAEAGIDVETELLEGKPAETIVQLAESRAADVIVLGSRGDGPLSAALRRSVATSIAARATVPVLTVPARAAVSSRNNGEASRFDSRRRSGAVAATHRIG